MPDYLQFHNNTYRVRLPVPEAYQAQEGVRFFLHETGTASRTAARKIAAPVIREKRKEWNQPRAGRMFLRDSREGSQQWLTPEWLFETLDTTFDMDVAASHAASWVPATDFLYERSLDTPWQGFIWCNPPFQQKVEFGQKFVAHGNGIVCLPVTPYAVWWQELVAQVARDDAILYVRGYVNFIDLRTMQPGGKASFGTCLIGIGDRAAQVLCAASLKGLGVVR